MSVCSRNWLDIVCKNGYVGMSVKEIIMKRWIVYMYLSK